MDEIKQLVDELNILVEKLKEADNFSTKFTEEIENIAKSIKEVGNLSVSINELENAVSLLKLLYETYAPLASKGINIPINIEGIRQAERLLSDIEGKINRIKSSKTEQDKFEDYLFGKAFGDTHEEYKALWRNKLRQLKQELLHGVSIEQDTSFSPATPEKALDTIDTVKEFKNKFKNTKNSEDASSSGADLAKAWAEGFEERLNAELRRIAPNIKEQLQQIYGEDLSSVKIGKLPSGVFRVRGQANGEEETRYIDRLGNIHKSLRTASKLTREELTALSGEFPQLAEKAKEYGFSLEQIVRYERLLGRNATKIEIVTDDGKLTLFVDNLGRAAQTMSQLKSQIPNQALQQLENRFSSLTEVLKQYGAELKDIQSVTQKGNITEISFKGTHPQTGIPGTYKAYGDAQGRIVTNKELASQVPAQQIEQLTAAYKSAFQEAERFGAGSENLVQVLRDEKSGIVGLTFALEDEVEGLKKVTLWTDKAGRVSRNKSDLGNTGFTSEELSKLEEKFPKLTKYINDYHIGMSNLRSAHTELSTGITRLTFSMKDEDGVIKVLNVALDRHGNILRDVQRKYQGFLDGVVRNTVEAAKWAVAIQLTYMPLQKLNELIQISIDNQNKLADSAIALNMKMSSMGGVFNDIYKIAGETATPMGEALEGFSAAFRATAGLGTNARRTAVALDVLKNSLILSKMASIDQKEAIDTLISSLRQMNMPLTESSVLLNKWIATSKSSQVGVNDLAEAYSVVGAAAKSSGFDIDTLNGTIAALAESTSYSGKEVGNIIRSFISNMSTDSARKEMTSLGISIEDVNGELRSSLDILREISSKYQEGLINDDQLKELARTLAGGSRRAAPMITLIKVYGKSLQLASVSANAANEAQEALNTKLDTAQSKVTNLSNAFQKLAQSVGTDGGVLDIFSMLAEALTDILKLMDGIVSYGGSTVTIFSTLLPMLAYLNNTGRLGEFSNKLSGKIFGMKKVTTPEGEVMQPKVPITGSQLMGGILSASLIGTAIAQALQGNEVQAAYNSAGQAIGAAAGAVLGGPQGAIIGQFIGSAIGNSFYKAMTDTGDSIAEVMAKKFIEMTKDEMNKNKDKGKEPPPTTKEMQDEVLGGTFLNFIANAEKAIAPLMGALGIWSKELAQSYKESPQLTVAAGAFNQKNGGIANLLISPEMKDKLAELFKYGMNEALGLGQAQETIVNPVRQIDYQARDVRLKNLKELSDVTIKLTDQTKQLYEAGKISSAEYARRLEDIGKLSAKLPYVYLAFGESATKAFGDASQAFDVWSKIMIQGTEDEKERLTSLVDAINLVQEQLQSGQGDRGQLQQTKEELRKELQDFVINTNKSIDVRTFKPPQVIDLKGWTENDVEELKRRLSKITSAYGKELERVGRVTKEAYDAWLDSLDEVYARIEGGKLERITRAPSWALNQAKSELAEEGKLSPSAISAGEGFQIRQVDFSGARAGEFHAALQWAEQFIKTNFPQYKLQPKDVGIIYKDGGTDVIHADNLQILLALNKLVEINQKQLDGIYNLPEGATFWVPWQAWNMQGYGSGGGTGTFTGTSEEEKSEKSTETPDYMSGKWSDEDWDRAWKEAVSKHPELVQPKYMQPQGEPLDTSKLPIEPQDERYKYYHFPSKVLPEKAKSKGTNELLPEFQNTIGILGILQALTMEFIRPGTQTRYGDVTKEFGKQFSKSTAINQQQQQSSVQFNLELSNRTILTLDGEVLAQAVSKYLGSELLIAARGASINKSVEVI